jgi:glc operon protein GlcG
MQTIHTIGYEEAALAIEFARTECIRRNAAAVIAVVDAFGEVLVLIRMDGAPLMSLNIAQNKAFSAAQMTQTSKQIGNAVKDSADGFDIAYLSNPRFIGFGGGVPLMLNGQCVGAVALSGLPEHEDMEIAEATAQHLLTKITG